MNEYERLAGALGDLAGWGLMVMVIALVVVVPAIILLGAALERLLPPPRWERKYPNLAANTRGRAAQARRR